MLMWVQFLLFFHSVPSTLIESLIFCLTKTTVTKKPTEIVFYTGKSEFGLNLLFISTFLKFSFLEVGDACWSDHGDEAEN